MRDKREKWERYVGVVSSREVGEAHKLLVCCLSACLERGLNQDTR